MAVKMLADMKSQMSAKVVPERLL